MRLRGGTRVFPDGTRLTPRQEEVIRLVEDGLTNGEIAERLGITLDGAKFHLTEIMNRFGVHSREDALRAWKQNRRGLFGLPIWGAPLLAGAGVVGVAFVIAAVFVVAWPGGDDQDQYGLTLERAAEKTSDATARFTQEYTIQLPGEPATPGQVATGELDFRRNRMRIRPSDELEIIVVEGKSYIRNGPDQLWHEFEEPNSNPGGSFTPGYWLGEMRKAKNVEAVGTELVRGETATKYQFTAAFPSVPQTGNTYAKTEIHFLVWLTDNRVLRIEEGYEIQDSGSSDIDGQKVFMRIDLDGWNEPVNIEAPGPDEIEP